MPSPLDDLSQSAGTIAAWIAGFGVAALAVWKHILRMRRDVRADQTEARDKRARDLVDGVYQDTIKGLQERLDALDHAFGEINNDFRREKAARMEAEERAVISERDRDSCERSRREMTKEIAECKLRGESLADRVSLLEARLRTLNGQA